MENSEPGIKFTVKDLEATSHSVTLCACMGGIKGTDDVFPQKTSRIACLGNYSFELCPFYASHA